MIRLVVNFVFYHGNVYAFSHVTSAAPIRAGTAQVSTSNEGLKRPLSRSRGPTFATTVLRHLQKIRNRFQIRTINTINFESTYLQAGWYFYV
jgi:hypothetical protein